MSLSHPGGRSQLCGQLAAPPHAAPRAHDLVEERTARQEGAASCWRRRGGGAAGGGDARLRHACERAQALRGLCSPRSAAVGARAPKAQPAASARYRSAAWGRRHAAAFPAAPRAGAAASAGTRGSGRRPCRPARLPGHGLPAPPSLVPLQAVAGRCLTQPAPWFPLPPRFASRTTHTAGMWTPLRGVAAVATCLLALAAGTAALDCTTSEWQGAKDQRRRGRARGRHAAALQRRPAAPCCAPRNQHPPRPVRARRHPARRRLHEA